MKRIYTVLVTCVVLFASCERKEEITSFPKNSPSGDVLSIKGNPASAPLGEPITRRKLDQTIIQKLEENQDFHWTDVDLNILWSAIQYGDNSVSVGYKPSGMGDISKTIHLIDIKSREWKSVHDAIIELVKTDLERINGREMKLEEFIIEDDAVLPILTFKLTDREIITKLYNLQNTRYIEPLDYWPEVAQRSSSGCDGSSEALNSADYTTISPSARLPWNYNLVNIPSAWSRAEGAGITIGVIDAGISSAQVLLNSQFNSGWSAMGRTITTDYTYSNSAFTNCAHGTSMSGLAVGPRNSLNASTGIAYKANLHFIRACDDVVLDGSSERTGVKNALVKMGIRADVKIISMSIGTPFSYSVLEDGANFANNMGKLIFAAAGTSLTWTSWAGVIYPAKYSCCVAVTGVRENGTTCGTCHDGSQVVFTLPMERTSDKDRNTISLNTSGTSPSYVGGSSSATAMAAGIAGLVWSARPSLSKVQVYSAMLTTSQFYPSPSSSHGYGNLNAGAAVNRGLSY